MVTAKHAESVKTFAADNGIDLPGVDVVGFHGQTVLHKPARGLTVQLGDGAALSGRLAFRSFTISGPRIWKREAKARHSFPSSIAR